MGNKKPQKQKRKQLTTNVSTKFEKINYYKKATWYSESSFLL